jgi:phage/plasmid-associated DNA primase
MKEVGDGRDYIYNGNIISDKTNIIELASMSRVYVDNPFNKVKNVINARNGVLELDYENKTVRMIGKKPDYMFSYCIDTVYDPSADSSVIDRELERILGYQQKELIYQIAALAIRDTDPDLAPSKVAYIFHGKPNTGKNTIQDLLLKFFGARVVSHIPLHEIIENKFVKPLLEGKLLNLDDELPSSLNKAESREIKSLTGGKTHTLEPKNVKPYEGIITALMVYAGNQFPKCGIAKTEAAFWERWDIIHFEHEFKVNEKFSGNLYTEQNMSGFFNKVIEKLFEINENGIKRNIGKLNIYNEWMSSSSNVYLFIQEATIESDIPVDYRKDELFAYYNEWCNIREIPKEDRAFTLQEFGKGLIHKCGVKDVHTGTGEHSHRYRMMRRYEKACLMPEPTIDFYDDEVELTSLESAFIENYMD